MKIVNPKSGETIATAVHNLVEFSVNGTRIVVAGGDYVATIQYPEVEDKCLITVADGKMEIEQPEYKVKEPDKEVQDGKEKENNPDESKGGESDADGAGDGDRGDTSPEPDGNSANDSKDGGNDSGGSGGENSGEGDGENRTESKGESSEDRKFTKIQ